jgi:hypothetical protein
VSTPLTLEPFGPDDLRGDVYFREDFIALHARHGVDGAFGETFSHGAALVPIPDSDRFDLETAWGYGGPIARDQAGLAMGLKAWKERQQAAGRIAEFVRLHPLLNPVPLFDHFDVLHFNRMTVMVDLAAGRDARWKHYSDSTRNCVRRSSRLLDVRRIGGDEVNLFQELYEAGLDRNRARGDYYFDSSYFRALLASPWARSWLISDGEGPLAVGCFLHANADICHYHLAGGNDRARRVNANYLMLEIAFEHFAGLGVRFMYLGGGRSTEPNDALLRFKMKFSRLQMPFYVGGIIHNLEAYKRFGGGRERFLCSGALPMVRP